MKKVKDYSRKGTVAFSVTSENGKYFAYLINDFPGTTGEGGGYKVLGKKRIKL